jgi:hypothetical protein
MMIFIGLGESECFETGGEGADNAGVVTFLVRGMIAFFTLGGWSGFMFAGIENFHPAFTVLLSLAFGSAGFVGIVYLVKAILRLQGSGNIETKNSIGKTAKVYIPIPPNREGMGKVTLTLQDRHVELDAMTMETTRIATGEVVTIIEKVDGNIVCVERAVNSTKKAAE